MNYDYRQVVADDVWEYIRNNEEDLIEFDSLEDYQEYLNDILLMDDSVTGNGSGSYTLSRKKAEECLSGNWDLIGNVIYEFGLPTNYDGRPDISKISEPEFWDVSVRCSLLRACIYEITESDEFQELWNNYHKKREEEYEYLGGGCSVNNTIKS